MSDPDMRPLLEVENLTMRYRVRGESWWTRRDLVALEGASFRMAANECLGVVGESGSGKSTLARLVAGLQAPTAGSIRLDGVELTTASAADWRKARRMLQIVFQDPVGSLDPLMRVDRIVEEPMATLCPELDAAARRERVQRLLDDVALPRRLLTRFPHELSGGQCQRVSIARALSVEPRVLILDEALSALDVSVQARMAALLEEIRRRRGLAMLFVSHSLGLVRRLCDRVIVLKDGRIVESGPVRSICEAPEHPYTRALVAAVPKLPQMRTARNQGVGTP